MYSDMCFDSRMARSATSSLDAEHSLLDFIREGAASYSPHHIGQHSRGFDLYLPWFMEIVGGESLPGVGSLGLPELGQLYMDAAWSLVMKGVLRPGPKFVNVDVSGDVYGKGFSLVHCEPR